MLVALSQAISVIGKYITTRPNTANLWFDKKVPADLRARYGKDHIRESLKTSDRLEAIRRASALKITIKPSSRCSVGTRRWPLPTLSRPL